MPVSLVCLFVSFLSSVRCPGPALGVVGVSTNTGTGMDTSMSSGSIRTYCRLSEELSGMTYSRLYACNGELGSLKVFNREGTIKVSDSTSLMATNSTAFIIKDPLKLFQGFSTSILLATNYKYYTFDPVTFALTTRGNLITDGFRLPKRCLNDTGTNYVICTSGSKAWKASLDTSISLTTAVKLTPHGSQEPASPDLLQRCLDAHAD